MGANDCRIPAIFLVHKPAGETSFTRVRATMEEIRAAGISRSRMPVCHGGTLDPFASGLLPILTGPATKLFEHLHPLPKAYRATIAWGAETDNGDPQGSVVATGDPSGLTLARLEAALRPFLGWTDQVPPLHSNKRVGGERAWARARRGEAFELPPSRVYLHDARWRSLTELELTCKGGYYVRALARDLGRALGCRAHLAALQRTEIGPWSDPAGEPVQVVGPALMPWAGRRALTDAELGELRAGRTIELGEVGPPEWAPPEGFPLDPPFRAVHQGRLVALLVERDGRWFASTLFRGGL